MLNFFNFDHKPVLSPFREICPCLCRFYFLISWQREKMILAAFLIVRNGWLFPLNLELECSGNFSCYQFEKSHFSHFNISKFGMHLSVDGKFANTIGQVVVVMYVPLPACANLTVTPVGMTAWLYSLEVSINELFKDYFRRRYRFWYCSLKTFLKPSD